MSAGTLLLFAAGGVLLIGGAELLVRGASRLAVAAGISPLVVGLTVVAVGTSAPELAVTIGAAHAGEAELALGNVVGSNIANVLLILGVSALVAPLVVSASLVRLEVPLVIAASVLVLLLGLDGVVGRADGVLLCAGAAAYTGFLVRRSRREAAAVQVEYAQAFGADGRRGPATVRDVILLMTGLALLVVGARWLVDAAVAIATALGVSELVIGLTVVAVGTSLPEIATSVLAILREERDIAVGNAVGSCLFNLLLVLGLGSLVAPTGIPVPPGALTFDIPVMITVAVAALPVFFTGYRIERWEGAVFVGYFLAYTCYLVLDATQHDALDALGAAMAWGVLPLTLLTFTVVTVRSLRRPGGRAE